MKEVSSSKAAHWHNARQSAKCSKAPRSRAVRRYSPSKIALDLEPRLRHAHLSKYQPPWYKNSFCALPGRGNTGASCAYPEPRIPAAQPHRPAFLSTSAKRPSCSTQPPTMSSSPLISRHFTISEAAREPELQQRRSTQELGSPERRDAHAHARIAEVINLRQPAMPDAHLQSSYYLCCKSHCASWS
jgi:hypothetical protein